MALSLFQGCIPLQGCQVNELTANPDEPGRHLFEIVPGEVTTSSSPSSSATFTSHLPWNILANHLNGCSVHLAYFTSLILLAQVQFCDVRSLQPMNDFYAFFIAAVCIKFFLLFIVIPYLIWNINMEVLLVNVDKMWVKSNVPWCGWGISQSVIARHIRNNI